MKLDITYSKLFDTRHNGSDDTQIAAMLKTVRADSPEDLTDQAIPRSIRLKRPLNLPAAKSEQQFLEDFKRLASKNKVARSYIGTGYYDTITPPVILRNILENPGWYTAYTPYQAEIAQGRLEALVNFQTMVTDLTGMEIANASLLDEGTAAAEAMAMLAGLRRGDKKKADTFFVDASTFPQTIDLLKTRAAPLGIRLVIDKLSRFDPADESLYGAYLQYPNNDGEVIDYTDIVSKAKENHVFIAMGADLLALTMLKPPGDMGADVVVGSSQRFGVPMGYGGPHAAFFATREAYKRQIPGRIIGASRDVHGNNAYRMALQTREQHIRREKATSNICTAQVLLAVISGMYAVYHGSAGLRKIAQRVHGLTQLLDHALQSAGIAPLHRYYFDTLKIAVDNQAQLRQKAEGLDINLRYFDSDHVGISLDETTTLSDVRQLYSLLVSLQEGVEAFDFDAEQHALTIAWPSGMIRSSDYLQHPVFHQYRSEHAMLRYIKRLENKDLSLTHSMIPLGSCTMKLNATTEMIPVTWPEFGKIHPFAPASQTEGYRQLFDELSEWLCEITGFDAVSLQPNSGAQGEYTGLMVIRAYHRSRGESRRNVTLIPSSAHGTNPASAIMAGMKVVIVQCDEEGNIDPDDLTAKAEQYKEVLAALMVTYPSTHGVFEESITTICDTIHACGGQVYMDGANMNAQVGLTSPANIGADVCHLNLHKTFCIPHGGGGPGMGPIGVARQLAPFLPGSPLIKTGGSEAITAVSAAPYGSASILTISYAYIAMMGEAGLKRATQLAILHANYIKERLAGHYEMLYTGKNGRAAHEMIIDCRAFKKQGVEVEDIAKRLMDYGFHAPTVSFPVPGTMMIEPTESESMEELDRFCTAMIEIRHEIGEIEDGLADRENNVLKNAPHTAEVVTATQWDRPYSREKAAYPLAFVKAGKFWPSVSRIDSVYGDRNLMCTCLPVSEYAAESRELTERE